MAEQETVTLQSETQRVDRLQMDLSDAVKSQETAIANMQKVQKTASTDALLELAEAVRGAKAKCDGVQATINAAQRTVKRLEWEQKSAKLTAVLNPIAGQVRQAIVNAKATMSEFKVTGIVVTVTDVDKETVMVAVKPNGPDVPKPPTKRGGGGGPRAARSSHNVTADGQTMTPREYVEAHVSEASPAIQEFLSGDTSKRVNITHEAERIAAKLGHTFS